jgi:hypothetical protein
MLRSWEWVRERWTRGGPERSVDPPEGAHSPRARRSLARGGIQPSREAESRRGGVQPLSEAGFARGGVQPSSEAEFRPEGASSPRVRRSFARGAPVRERGGVSPEGVSSPRARWSFA